MAHLQCRTVTSTVSNLLHLKPTAEQSERTTVWLSCSSNTFLTLSKKQEGMAVVRPNHFPLRYNYNMHCNKYLNECHYTLEVCDGMAQILLQVAMKTTTMVF